MAITSAGRARCDMKDLRVAIFEQQKLIEMELNLADKTLPTYMNDRIPDGGEVDPHDDGRTLQMRTGFQAPLDYDQRDNSMRELTAITQDGQGTCGTRKVTIGTLGNEHDPEAVCDGVDIVDFNQGYTITGSQDYDLKVATPERCMEQLSRLERRFVQQTLDQEARSFVNVTMQSHDHHLYKLSVVNGGANASVMKVTAGYIPRLVEGGWDEVPQEHVTLWWLEHFHRRIMQRKIGKGHVKPGENYISTFEVTKDCLKNMLLREHIERSGQGGMFQGVDTSQLRLDFKELDHKDGVLAGRQFYVYNNMLRFEFNEYPIRGYCKPTGPADDCEASFEFIRVYHLHNVEAEDGAGSFSDVNPDYYYDTVTCDGVSYPLMELIPHIDRESFKTFGLAEAIGPNGKKSHGNKFQLNFLDGADLGSSDCPNFFKNKYRWGARDAMRWQNIHPEYSGWIMHKIALLAGYDMNLPENNFRVQEGAPCGSPEELNNDDVKETCQNGAWTNCPDDTPACDPATNITRLTPCGDISTPYYGEEHTVLFRVERSRDCADTAASVEYDISNRTGISGTHYQVVDEAGANAPSSGTLNWAADEYGDKVLCVKIIGALADTPAPDPEGPCCVETEATPNDAIFSVEIFDATGTNIADCDTLTVAIKNRS